MAVPSAQAVPCLSVRREFLPPNHLLGVTTNSASGVSAYDEFFPVFAAMEKHDLVLNLHGEVPSDPGSDITVLSAEEAFLPTLFEIHQRFPKVQSSTLPPRKSRISNLLDLF